MAFYSDEKIDEVRSSVNIVHYITQFVNLKKAGVNFKGVCPFHTEKTPSFVVSPEKQIYHCFGCGAGGNLLTFIKEYEKVPFVEAVKKAADFAGIQLPKLKAPDPEKEDFFNKLYSINDMACNFFENNLYLAANIEYLNYFLNRKISEKTIRLFRLGYASDSYSKILDHFKKNNLDLSEALKLGLLASKDGSARYYDKFRHRVIFPFFNLSGKAIGFGGRQLKDDQIPKYLNSQESPVYKKGEILYGLNLAIQPIREKNFVVLVEGYFDLLRLFDNGMKNVIASSGTALTENQAKLIRRYTKDVYIAYDGDFAGRKAAIRNAQILEKAGLNSFIIETPDGEDPDSLVLNNGLEFFEKLLSQKLLPIEYQIKHFQKNNPQPTLNEKNSFIQEVINNLVEINDPIKSGLYIHQVSEQLQIAESMLVEQLNRYRRAQIKYKKRAEQRKAEQKPVESEEITEKTVTLKSGIYKAEAGLISLLLDGDKNIQKFIFSNIEQDFFEDDNLIELYNVLVNEFEETGNLSTDLLISHFQANDVLINLISELALSDKSNPQKLAEDCIFQLKKWNLEKESLQLKQLINQESGHSDSILHYNQQLILNRKSINQLEKDHRKRSAFKDL